MLVKRLWKNEGGIGNQLVDDEGNFVAFVSAVWTVGGKPPVGSVIKAGNSRYPKFFQVIEN